MLRNDLNTVKMEGVAHSAQEAPAHAPGDTMARRRVREAIVGDLLRGESGRERLSDQVALRVSRADAQAHLQADTLTGTAGNTSDNARAAKQANIQGAAQANTQASPHAIPQLAPPRGRADPEVIDALIAQLAAITPAAQREAAAAALQEIEASVQAQDAAGKHYEQAVDKAAGEMAKLDAWSEDYRARREALEAIGRKPAAGDEASGIGEASEDDSATTKLAEMRRQCERLLGEGRVLLQSVLAAQEEADVLFRKADAAAMYLPANAIHQDENTLKSLLRLLGSLAELMESFGQQQALAQREQLQALQEARLKKLQEDADKSRAMQEKAAIVSNVMGIVGKVAGVAAVVLGLLGAFFSGPVGLAVAAIGMSFLVADEVVKGVTGESLIDKALAPVMDVMQAAAGELVSKLGGWLEALGLDSMTAMMVAAAAVAVIMVAVAAVLAFTGVGRIMTSGVGMVLQGAAKVVARVLEKMFSQLLPKLLKRKLTDLAGMMSSEFTKLMSRVLKRVGLPQDGIARQVFSQRLTFGANISGSLHVAAGSTAAVVEGVHQVEQSKVRASMMLADSELDLIADMLGRLLSTFQSTYDGAQDYLMRASEVIRQHASTGEAITGCIRRAAAL